MVSAHAPLLPIHMDSLAWSRPEDSFLEISRIVYQLFWPPFTFVPVRSLGRGAYFWIRLHVLQRGGARRHHPAELQHASLHERNHFLHPWFRRCCSSHGRGTQA